MPTSVASPSPSPAVKTSIPSKQRSPGHSRRKTRVVRRRGRAKGDVESEDEIVREVGTDSETEDDLSTTDFDSDTELASERAVADGRSRPLTPSTSDSPQSQNKDIPTHIDADPQPFFPQPSTWEEMVAEENVHGPAELPVINFADFNGEAVSNGHVPHPLPTRSKTPLERGCSSRSETKVDERGEADHAQTTSRQTRSSNSRKLTGQSARQAYQQRLESDPSFVPTVGGFWGHDERLLDKDLRSLSGWWRGRRQNRGRGRGVSMRGGGHSQRSAHDSEDSGNALDLPAIERTWTHDGFEEMKRKEEQRRATLQQQQQQQANQTRGGHVGGGGFASSRGGRGSPKRAGPSSASHSSTTHAQGRVWYTMKPELMWTRQYEAFLFFDFSTKPRNRQGPSFRVKLPGSNSYMVQSKFQARQHDIERHWPKSELRTTDSGGNAYTVRIPKTVGKEKAIEPLTTVEETSLDEIFTVRPNLVTPIPIPIPESDNKLCTTTINSSNPSSTDGKEEKGPQSEQALISQLEQLTVLPQESDEARLAKTEEAVLKKSSPEQPSSTTDERPILPPIQTVFTPPPGAHPSPAYGVTYPYGPTLPPGVALNAHGMPYELATGRPVFLAPPLPLYTPRPLMPHMTPGAVYIPNHLSPDFLAQSSSHTPPMNGFVDPATGTPLFSFPRQTRIEIRAPIDEYDGKGPRKGQSHQSNTAIKTPSISSPPQPPSQPSYPTLTRPTAAVGSPLRADSEARDLQANGDFSNHQRTDSHMVPYPPYYYYPESFGYYPYMDMSQVGQYEAYSSDPRGAQGTVYY